MRKEVKPGLIFFDEIPATPSMPRETTIVNITPTKKTGFSLSKDDEGTYDIHIRFNPTRFFVEATEAVAAFKGFKAAISGLSKART